MKKLRVALIGCGSGHAESSHLPPLHRLDQVSLEALCDLNEESLHTAMAKYGVKKGFSDFRRMIDEVELDAVFTIIHPSNLKEVVIPCFEKGLAVSVEKTPGVNASETRAMSDAAERNQCLNMVGFNRRFSPVVQKAVEIVPGNARRLVTGTFYRTYAFPIEPVHAGVHRLDIMRCLGGDVAGIQARAHRKPDGELDGISAILEYENGSVGAFQEKHYCGVLEECYEIHAEGISVSIDYQKGALRISRPEVEEAALSNEDIVGSRDRIDSGSSFRETRHFVDCVIAGKSPFPDLKDSLKTMELNEGIFALL